MKEFFQLEPEVSGELGANAIINNSIHPPKVEKLEFVFKGWLGDCLIECFPVFLITEKVAKKLTENNITGFSIKSLEIRKDYPFDELYPNLILPKFVWIDINGEAKKSDFGIKENLLITSDKALKILQQEGLNYCDIKEISF